VSAERLLSTLICGDRTCRGLEVPSATRPFPARHGSNRRATKPRGRRSTRTQEAISVEATPRPSRPITLLSFRSPSRSIPTSTARRSDPLRSRSGAPRVRRGRIQRRGGCGSRHPGPSRGELIRPLWPWGQTRRDSLSPPGMVCRLGGTGRVSIDRTGDGRVVPGRSTIVRHDRDAARWYSCGFRRGSALQLSTGSPRHVHPRTFRLATSFGRRVGGA